ncbi:putative ankyrin repeat protein RF_0381 [Mytilus edulis]|uniref:putative ankyrin repeat protein RF_0381 n=1 Tax=Mytilus edulis TaxID=6550 RepID=UPI0039F08E77
MGLTALHVYFKSYHIKERSYSCYGDLYLLEILDALLAKKPNVNLKDNDEISPLQLAIRNQKTEAVEKLLFSNPIMPFEDSDKLEAFEMCLTIEPQVCLQILDVLSDHLNLANTVDVFFCKFWKYINTHDCSRNREVLDSVTYKILSTEEEVQVNLASDSEYSPLMYFCHFGCFQAVKMLLSHKADVNYVGMRGTILHELLDMTDDDNAVLLFDCLLKEQPKMNISDNMGKTVAEKAIDILCGKRSASSSMGYQYYSPMNERRFKNISLCFQKLLESGVTLDSKDLNDALLMCAEKSDFKGMKSLIRHGADFYRKDIIGNSIFHLCWLASLHGGLDFLRFFIESEHSLKRIDSVDNSILSSLLTFGGIREYGSVTNDKDISEISSFLIQNGACCVKDKEGNGPLHLAAKNGHLSTIGVLLKLDSVSLYDQNEKGDTAVHICLKHPKENICDVIKILLENNSAKLGLNLRNESVLYLAMVAGQRIRTNNVESVTYQLVKTLLRNEADPNEHSRDHIPLFVALETGDVMTSKLLLNASANINATNRRGKCSLHIIYENTWATDSKLSLTQLLLENGLNVNLVDESGKCALFSLVNRYTGHYFTDSDVNSFEEIFNVLLKYGADLNLSDKLDETVLSYICSSGRNVEIGYILLKSGASPKKGCCLQNLLESLQIYGNKSCFLSLISSLLQKGADPNRRRIEGSNIIDCVKNGNILLVEEFIKYGADVNGCDNFKKTALHYACNIGHSKDRYAITTLLVKHGSNLNVASILGERPLDIVVENMIKEMTNAAFFSRANNCGTYTVDLSLLNVLVCGGADLCPVITDTIEQFYESSSFTVHATPLNYRNRNKSALYLLISNGLFQTAEYLLRSGWDVEKEEWFDAFDVSKLDLIENNTMNYSIYKRHDVKAKKAEFKSFLQTVDKGPKLLTTICRKLIRQQLLLVSNGSEIETKISTLPLPEKIKRFLSLKECILENEIIQFE